MGGGRARETEMLGPLFARAREVRVDVGAVENVAGAVGVEHVRARHGQRRQGLHSPALVVPDETVLSERHATDEAALAFEQVAQLLGT
jgi:hypothetical protein